MKKNFRKGQLHGDGKVTYTEGKIEEGEFRRGKRDGQGTRSFPNGEVWTGKFNRSKFNMNSPLLQRINKPTDL